MWQKVKNYYHLVQAILANLYYGFPSKKLTVIGVTGTDGKTTTTSIIYHILNESGYNASMITSIGAYIGGQVFNIGFHVTNPASWPLQKFLKQAAEQESRIKKQESSNPHPNPLPKGEGNKDGRKFMVLETTSHGLDQFRVWGVNYEIGVITNVTKEHLDYHKTYDNYVKTKAKLIKMAKIGVINRDDQSYDWIVSELAKTDKKEKVITYGKHENADLTSKVFPFTTHLIGEFNEYNALAAIAATRALGVPDEKIRAALKTFDAPKGREEIIYPVQGSSHISSNNNKRLPRSARNDNLGFTVMIDFAHTPNSIEQLLKSLRPKVKGRLIHVFGSAGLRDAEKRPEMGRNSSEYADVIILTAEDPRTEDVNDIMAQIESGIKIETGKGKKVEVHKIADRKKAIEMAIGMAENEDYVVLTGKAHEKSMNYGQGEEPWDEFKIAYDAIKKRDPKFTLPK